MSDVEPNSADESRPAAPSAEFVQLFTHHQRRLFLYILSQVPNPIEAEEVLQETNVVIWSKFSQFREGTNFLAWVSQIANFEVMKYRTRKKRSRLHFSDEFLETVSREALNGPMNLNNDAWHWGNVWPSCGQRIASSSNSATHPAKRGSTWPNGWDAPPIRSINRWDGFAKF